MDAMVLKLVSMIFLVFLPIVSVQSFALQEQMKSLWYALAVDWSPDGTHIAAVGQKQLLRSDEGFILIFDSITGQIDYQAESQSGGYQAVSWSPDSHFLAIGGYGKTVQIFDVTSKTMIATLTGHKGVITSINWNSTGTQLISSSPADQEVIVWDTKTYKPIQKIKLFNSWTASFSPDDEKIGIASGGVFVFPSSLTFDQNLDAKLFQYHPAYAIGMAWSHSGKQFAIGTQQLIDPNSDKRPNPLVLIFNLDSPEPVKTFEVEQETALYGIQWSANDQEIATYGVNGAVRILDAATGTLLDTFPGNEQRVETNFSFSPYGGRLIYGGSTFDSISTLPQIQFNQAPSTKRYLTNIVQMVVPAPSFEKLQSITHACGMEASLEASLISQIDAQNLSTFSSQVETLTDAQIPPLCKADLMAVAEALMAK